MKKIFSLIAMCLVSLSMMAQSQLVATLTHEGTTTEYYGANAFISAYNAASDGDLITLSAGAFNTSVLTVSKSLTIRGNGCEGEEATVFNNEIYASKGSSELPLSFEGIRFNIYLSQGESFSQTTFKKCDFETISSPSATNFIQCRIKNRIELPGSANVSFINSIINNANGGDANSSISLLNCIIYEVLQRDFIPCFVRNSIIVTNNPYSSAPEWYFPNTFQCDHCIITGGARMKDVNEMMRYSTNSTNYVWKDWSETFITNTGTGSYAADNDYTLTDEAKLILGTDNKEYGIYGGDTPYTSVVTYPRFTTFNVAEKAENGTLSVTIAAE